jgi:hypothetical protein
MIVVLSWTLISITLINSVRLLENYGIFSVLAEGGVIESYLQYLFIMYGEIILQWGW